METKTRKITITLPLADLSFLKKLSENMGWQFLPVSAKCDVPAECSDETEYVSSSERMVEVIMQGMKDAQCGNYKIVNVDEL